MAVVGGVSWFGIILVYVVPVVLGFLILYWAVRKAVRDGIRDRMLLTLRCARTPRPAAVASGSAPQGRSFRKKGGCDRRVAHPWGSGGETRASTPALTSARLWGQPV